MADKIELKPCPWCGGEAYFAEDNDVWGYVIECHHNEGCAVGDYPEPPYDRRSVVVGDLDCCGNDRDKVIEAWNTRAERTCKVVKKHGKHPVTNNDVVLYNCSECGSWLGLAAKFCPNCGARIEES